MSQSQLHHAPSSEHLDELFLCRHCDLVVQVPFVEQEHKAICPRCKHHLYVHKHQANFFAAVYALTALFMLAIACSFIFIHIRINGLNSEITLLNISLIMVDDGFASLAVAFLLFTLLIPAVCLMIILVFGFNFPIPISLKMKLLKLYQALKEWCMAEIFVAGILVSFVKLISYGEIGIDESFISYVLFALLQIKALNTFNEKIFWNKIGPPPSLDKALQAGATGIHQDVRLCLCCSAILPAQQIICPRCHKKGHVRLSQSIAWTIALVMTALLIYIPANLLSIMTSVTLGTAYESNIMEGVIFMWQDGAYPVALVIFIASIMIPSLKIMGLIWLCLCTKIKRNVEQEDCHRMQIIYGMIEFVGRWSMIDIFVVAVISALIRVGVLISVYPDNGAILFTLVVVTTMIAAIKFDSRLLWDRLPHQFS